MPAPDSWSRSLWPPGLPAPMVDKLQKTIAAVLKEPEIVQAMRDKVFIVESSTPEQLRARIEQDITKWRDLAIKAMGPKRTLARQNWIYDWRV